MSDQNYDANDMQHLENLDAVRKRVGMYLGSSDSRAKNHTVFEIFDNSVDEAIAGYCTDITVTLHQDGSVEVEDNGRGVPTDIHKKTGLPAVIAVFTLLHFGGKFGGGTYKSAGGLHGVGASVVNAVSSRLDFTVKRDGQVIAGSFQRGKPGKFSGEGSDAKFTPHPPQTLTTVRKMKKGEQTGTNVRYWHDKTIFLPESKIEAGAIRQRLRQTAFLIPGLTLTLNDHLTHPDHPKTETFKYDGGIVDMVDVTSHDTKICDTIHIQGSGTFKETVPMLNKDGEMVSTEMERTVDVDVALRWGNGYDTHVNTFVNVVATPNGGTHLKGFERALVQTLRKAYDGTRLLKANDDPPILEDFEEGLTAVVSIGVPEPQFVGQTKEELGTAGVTKVVQTVVAEGLSAWVNGKKKTQVRTVLEKVANASKVRVAHRTQKDAARRKTALEGASMPAKLVDCRAIGVEGSEIFVVEGDSALGCIFSDTVLKIVGTKDLSFKELADDWAKGITHFGYATDEHGDIVVVPLVEPRLTRRDAEVVEVELDNGETIQCTPDHPFRLRDGSYKQAEDLQAGDSLMPLYTRLSSKRPREDGKKDLLNKYEMVWQNHKGKWVYTHHLSDAYNLETGFYQKSDGDTRHHIDFDKHNNDPRNLKRMGGLEHFELHRQHREDNLERIDAGYRRWLDEEGGREKQSAQLTMQWQDPEFRATCLQRLYDRNNDPVWRAFFTQSFQDWYYGLSVDEKAQYAEEMRRKQEDYWSVEDHRLEQSERTRQYFADNPDHRERHRQMGKAVWEDEDLREWRSKKTVEQFSDPAERERQSEAVKTWQKNNPEWGVQHSEMLVGWWAENGEEHRKKTRAGRQKYIDSTPRDIRVGKLKEGKKIAALKRISELDGLEHMDVETLKTVYDQQRLANCPTGYKFDRLLDEFFDGDVERLKDAAANVNHTVVAVRRLNERVDVYDVTVDTYHNFALAAGIFVHNSARQGRNSEYQALLPIRGKILNVQKASLKQMLDNTECASIIQVLGAGSGKTFDLEQMRYSRLIIFADADKDGQHIACLCITLAYKYLRGLVEAGRLFSAMPPLFKVETMGRNKEKFYVHSNKELDVLLARLKRERKQVKFPIQRYKGLGEMDAEELWETTMDPATRSIKRITVSDAEAAEEMLELLMGNNVPNRRDYIVENSDEVEDLDI